MKRIDRPVRGTAAACLLVGIATSASPAFADPVPTDDYLYRLDAVTSESTVDVVSFNNRVVYTTEAGFSRTVRVAVRTPPGATESPLPVVIVAHGGGEQPNTRNPATTLPRWGEALARAGYLVINVLHGSNVGVDRAALCQAIGFPVVTDGSAIGSTLADLGAALVAASESGESVSVDVAALVASHPGLFEHLQDITDEGEEESPIVAQAVDILKERLLACGSINRLGLWDRPYDIAAVVNALHDGAFPELEGWMDLTKVALLGHSNGTSSVLNAVGMQRALPNGVKVPPPFPAGHPRRPQAVIALSPMGVNTYGLFDTVPWSSGSTDSKEHSWAGLTDIPVITMTSDGDNHCKTRFVCADSDSGSRRQTPFYMMPPEDKYMMFVADRFSTEIVSSHEMFGDLDKPGVCRSASLAAECAFTVKWIKSTAIAFLDAYLLDVGRAKSFLKSKKLAKASDGIASIVRK